MSARSSKTSRKTSRKRSPRATRSRAVARQTSGLGIACLLVACLLALALCTWPSGGTGRGLIDQWPVNACGPVGALVAGGLARALGVVPALVPVALLAAWGWNRLRRRRAAPFVARSLVIGALTLFGAAVLGLVRDQDPVWVGWVGSQIAVRATQLLGELGSHVVLWTGLAIAALAVLDVGVGDLFDGIAGFLFEVRERWRTFVAGVRHTRERVTDRHELQRQKLEVGERQPGRLAQAAADWWARRRAPAAPLVGEPSGATDPDGPKAAPVADARALEQLAQALDPGTLKKLRRQERERLASLMRADGTPPRVTRHPEPAPPVEAGTGALEAAQSDAAGGADSEAPQAAGAAAATGDEPAHPVEPADSPEPSAPGGKPAIRTQVSELEAAPAPDAPSRPRSSYKLKSSHPRGTRYVVPDTALLKRSGTSEPALSEAALVKNSKLLERTLSHFDITGKVTEVVPGPVITRYAFEPAPGVRVNQILSRSDDLALALRAHRLRILAPIPGQAAVGIEVPNPQPEVVRLGDLIDCPLLTKSGARLTVALGKDVAGAPVAADLERMPHILIAGATGAGKSVSVNSLIISLLMRLTPRQLRLVMVDPKLIELTGYNDIPHLMLPVVTEAKKAARALRYMVHEMQRRYDRLSKLGVRNIEDFNAQVRGGRGGRERLDAGGKTVEEMPYVVVIVDELADLMLTLGNEIEDPIARLAQMARAVGIHLVLATQRPSVDVITGMIKANFPSRIAFQVASKVDSRTILDQNGAEVLLGRGDMLYLPAGRPDAIRVHGAFVSDPEIQAVVRHWRDFAPPTEEIDLESVTAQSGGPSGAAEEDDLFEDARRIVVQTGVGSTSMLQRRLKVGYARAGRLMDLLEQAGVVGPPEGSKAREVLVRPTEMAE